MSIYKKTFFFLASLLFCLFLPGLIPTNLMLFISGVLSIFIFLGLTYIVLKDNSDQEIEEDPTNQ